MLSRSSVALVLALGPLGGGVVGCAPGVTQTRATITFASPEAPDLTSRGAAAVRLRVQDASVSLTRSGVMIDPRGYLLTTFSAVGVNAARARGGRPGTLYGADEYGPSKTSTRTSSPPP